MSADGTLILTRSDVQRLAAPRDYFDAVAESFRAFARGGVDSPPPMEILGRGGAFHAKGASMEIGGRRLAALKCNGNFPLNPARGLPTIQGAILFCDADDGALLAVLDSIEITLRRTAAASAVATDLLARKSAETLLICGCGVQGRAHLEALAPLRRFRRILAYDVDRSVAGRFVEEARAASGVLIEAASSLDAAAPQADVIVATTPSRAPYLLPQHVKAGAFVAAVGADNPGKSEIAPALMAGAAVIADVAAQCAVMGDLRAAVAAGALAREDIRGELGDALIGAAQGRIDEKEIVIFDSTGAAFQDLAAAAMIFERASRDGIGRCATLNR